MARTGLKKKSAGALSALEAARRNYDAAHKRFLMKQAEYDSVSHELEDLRRADADALQALIALAVPSDRLDAVVVGRMVDSLVKVKDVTSADVGLVVNVDDGGEAGVG